MKKLVPLFFFVPLAMMGCSTSYVPSRDYSENNRDNQSYDDYNTNYNNTSYNSAVSYQTFYDQLQPYGNWINYPGHGYVWQPIGVPDFRPYETNGRWVSTVDGWAWASNYSWGWAPFHYGRWLNDARVGWLWVPGYEWAPAWVTWGSYNNYYAWAPLAPGINISVGNTWRAPYDYWSCVPRDRFSHSNFSRYITRPNQYNVENNITIINNYNTYNNNQYYNKGPEYREVERFSNRKITPVAITSASKPGETSINGNQMRVYRPTVTNNVNTQVAPSKIANLPDIKRRTDNIAEAVPGVQTPAAQQGVTRPARINPRDGATTGGLKGEVSTDMNNGLNNGSGNTPRVKLPQADNNAGINTRPQTNNLPERTNLPVIRRQESPATNATEMIKRRPEVREVPQPDMNSRINNRRELPNNNRMPQTTISRPERQPVSPNSGNTPSQPNNRIQNIPRVMQQPASPVRIESSPQNNRNSQIQRPQGTTPSRPDVRRPRQ